MEPKKVNSISELDGIQEPSQVTLDGVVEQINKHNGLLYIGIRNGNKTRTLKCESFGVALLGKNFEPSDLVYVSGTYLPKRKSLSLEECGYQTSTKFSELPQ